MTKWYVDECIVVNGTTLDKGFYIHDDGQGQVSWFGPWQDAKEQFFPFSECIYENGTPVSVEDGELLGEIAE